MINGDFFEVKGLGGHWKQKKDFKDFKGFKIARLEPCF
jgi:hypothetical protein